MSHQVYRRGKQPVSASENMPKREIVSRTGGALSYSPAKPMDQCDMIETLVPLYLRLRMQ
jgi:hypothetical protein